MKILDGNAFKLRITCEQNVEDYKATTDMSQVESLLVNFVRRGRITQTSGVDSAGRIVASNSGNLAIGIYGVELTGYYNGAPWRFYADDVFEIINDENEVSESVIDEGVPIYDVTFTLSLGGSEDISFVDSAIINHNENEFAHGDIRRELGDKIDDILVDDESVVETDPLTGKKEVKFDSDNFGKVDDVKVNGTSVVSQKVANIPVPTKTSDLQNDSDFVNENDMQSALDEKQDKIDTVNLDYQEDGGSPSASASFEDGELDISMKNMKMKFSELTAEEKESLRGPQGIPGEGAIWTGQGEEIMALEQETGQAINKGMSQKAITDIIQGVNQNYIENVYLDYTTKAQKTKTGWGIYNEPIPCVAGQKVVWNHGVYMSGVALVFYNENMSALSAYGTQNSGPRTVTAPANTAYVNGSFLINVNGVNNITPIKVGDISYEIIDAKEGIEGKIDSLQNRMESVEESVDNIPQLEGGKGQSETSGMTQKAITDAIDEILDGREPNYIKNKYFKYNTSTPPSIPEDKIGCGILKENIPITNNSNITWRFGSQNIGALVVFDENGNALANWGANDSYQRGIAKAQIPANAASLNCSFNLNNVTTPLTIDGVDYPIVESIPSLLSMRDYEEVKDKLEDLEDIVNPTDSENGYIGQNYPEQVKEINNNLGASLGDRNNTYFKRLQFIHVSDNHGVADYMGYASQFLGYCPAKFLVNTGDLVVDKYTDNHRTIDYAKAATKPAYLVLGNHDYYKCPSHQDQYDAWYGDAETEGTLNYHNAQLGGDIAEHTYYSVDNTSEKVKCIILDMNDGWPDENLASRDLADFSVGKFSQAQINWLISELQSAIINSYHVAIFIHITTAEIDPEKKIIPFTDYYWQGRNEISFLYQMVDAFINGSSVEFSYNGNTYNTSFATKGHFIAWFSGHTHYDIAGWLKNYPNQFAVILTRPNASQMYYGGVGTGAAGGVTRFNFVTIDTAQKSLSVYRVGQQKTVFGIDRKSFRIFYK